MATEWESFAAGAQQLLKPANDSTPTFHLVAEYWDIAVAPIRPGRIAVSLWRLVGYTEQTAPESHRSIVEVAATDLSSFCAQSLTTSNYAEIRGGDSQIVVKRTRQGAKELFVGVFAKRKVAHGWWGPINDTDLMALRRWVDTTLRGISG